jgi:hypothetical protein
MVLTVQVHACPQMPSTDVRKWLHLLPRQWQPPLPSSKPVVGPLHNDASPSIPASVVSSKINSEEKTAVRGDDEELRLLVWGSNRFVNISFCICSSRKCIHGSVGCDADWYASGGFYPSGLGITRLGDTRHACCLRGRTWRRLSVGRWLL